MSDAPLPAWHQTLAGGRWTEFGGLPPGLREDELLAALGRRRGPAASRSVLLSREPRTLVEQAGLRYWLGEAGEVILVELEDPPSALPVAELLAELGPPAREGAGRYRRFGAMTTEYVYPDRGLALTVAESYDDPPAFRPMIAAVQLFSATDLAGFVTQLGGTDRGGPQL